MRWFVLATALLVACGGDEATGSPRIPPSDDDLVFTDLVLDNQTDRTVAVVWDQGSGLRISDVVAPSAALTFAAISAPFTAPAPSDSLLSLEVTEDGLPIHRQEPVVDTLWSIESGPRATATLVMNDALIGLDTRLPEGSCCCESVMSGDVLTETLMTEA